MTSLNWFELVLNWSELVSSPTGWTARTELQFDAVASLDWLQLQFCQNPKIFEPVGLQSSDFKMQNPTATRLWSPIYIWHVTELISWRPSCSSIENALHIEYVNSVITLTSSNLCLRMHSKIISLSNGNPSQWGPRPYQLVGRASI